MKGLSKFGRGILISLSIAFCNESYSQEPQKEDEIEVNEIHGQLFIQRRFNMIRYMDEFDYLKNAEKINGWEKIKFIKLNEEGTSYLSLGGNSRSEFVYLRTATDGEETKTENEYFWDQRLLIHTDFHLKNHRLFAQLVNAWRVGDEASISSLDEDDLTFQQLFYELDFGTNSFQGYLRMGRQSMFLGSGRFFSVREGPPNMRLSYDGARLGLANGIWNSNIFYLKEVFIEDGVFDNEAFGDNELYGVYSSLDLGSGEHTKVLDFYYAGLGRPNVVYQNLTGQEERHTLGLRFLYQSVGERGYDVDAEANYQFGDFQNLNINAYSVSLNADHFWNTTKNIEHRFGIKANVFSGDGSRDNDLGTFNPIYPALGYLSRAALINFSNLYTFHPSYRLTLSNGFAVNIENAWLWRQSKNDIIYNAAGLPFSSITGEDGISTERYVGMLPSIEAEWAVNAFVSFELFYSALYKGDFFDSVENDIHNVVFTTYLRF
ncbi:alginate export family protein [Aquimarina sp. U1-2]|uniref:alginate export family protein n=1 Tax=Aquimarina sp. U1-2 TaxID=2823141 RepID=UPI001AECA6AA|nr:alginate export family protein [Aquimarina sp. U1-2]MBP2831235.1 alginate export family protein [Aquimarina sp. U1-2]